MNPSQNLGKATEMRVSSMLLSENRELYLPAVDDHGVDMIVRTKDFRPGDGTKPEHYEFQEVQVKSASDGGLFVFSCSPRPNYWFVFYITSLDTMWLINSQDVSALSSINVKGKSIGKHSLNLRAGKRERYKQPKFIINNFNNLP